MNLQERLIEAIGFVSYSSSFGREDIIKKIKDYSNQVTPQMRDPVSGYADNTSCCMYLAQDHRSGRWCSFWYNKLGAPYKCRILYDIFRHNDVSFLPVHSVIYWLSFYNETVETASDYMIWKAVKTAMKLQKDGQNQIHSYINEFREKNKGKKCLLILDRPKYNVYWSVDITKRDMDANEQCNICFILNYSDYSSDYTIRYRVPVGNDRVEWVTGNNEEYALCFLPDEHYAGLGLNVSSLYREIKGYWDKEKVPCMEISDKIWNALDVDFMKIPVGNGESIPSKEILSHALCLYNVCQAQTINMLLVPSYPLMHRYLKMICCFIEEKGYPMIIVASKLQTLHTISLNLEQELRCAKRYLDAYESFMGKTVLEMFRNIQIDEHDNLETVIAQNITSSKRKDAELRKAFDQLMETEDAEFVNTITGNLEHEIIDAGKYKKPIAIYNWLIKMYDELDDYPFLRDIISSVLPRKCMDEMMEKGIINKEAFETVSFGVYLFENVITELET